MTISWLLLGNIVVILMLLSLLAWLYQRLQQEVAERRKAEATLREEAQFMTAILNASPESVFLMDIGGTILGANEVTAQRFRRPLTEVLGANVYALLPPHLASARRAQMEIIIRTGEPVQFDEARGKWVIKRSFYPILNEQGAVTRIAVFSTDVTERRRTNAIMEARLRLMCFAETHSLDELLEATLDETEALTHSVVGFYHFLHADQQTLTLQAWSTRTKREFCRAEGHSVHYTLTQAGVWADCVRLRQPVIHNDYPALPHRQGLPPGHAQVLRELVVPVFREDRIVAILGVGNKAQPYDEQDVDSVAVLADLAWDITERKRAREALLDSEARYRRIVETTNEGIWTTDEHGIVTFVNPRMAFLLGYRLPKILGRPADTFLFEADWPDYQNRMLSRRQGHSGQYERRLRRQDGSELWTIVSAVPIMNARNQFCGSLVMFTDITLLKKQQRQLEQIAHYDALTGLPNRVLLADRMQLTLAQARRAEQRIAVCYLDLDGFKPVNDAFGHDAGDRLLIAFAQRMTQSLRESDTVARLGGDEFVLLLSGQDADEDYQRTLDRLLAVIAEPYDLGSDSSAVVSASIGVAVFPDDGAEPEELLRRADQAMYQVKHSGRHGYRRLVADRFTVSEQASMKSTIYPGSPLTIEYP